MFSIRIFIQQANQLIQSVNSLRTESGPAQRSEINPLR